MLYMSGGMTKNDVERLRRFGNALSLLTENLYKYRAVVDEDLAKRNVTGPVDNQMAIHESLTTRLTELCDECGGLYRSITKSIKEALERRRGKRDQI